MINLPPMRKDRTLLATVTGEPFQPARLYYAIPSKTVVARIFRQMHCMDEDADNDRWVWLYTDEASKLEFARPRAELPDQVHPIVIGVARFPPSGGMTLQVRSFARAIAAARFMEAFGAGSSRPELARGPSPVRPSKSKRKARVKRKSRRK